MDKSIEISEVKEKLVSNFKKIFEYDDVITASRNELMAVNLTDV